MGRLAFVFVPGSHDNLFTTVKGLGGYQFPTYAETGALERTFVDLRDTTEVTIDCPFVSPSSMVAQQSHIGYLCVYVVDTVTAPSTVTPAVPVMIEAAMSKLSLSAFVPSYFAPTVRNLDTEIYAQSGFAGARINEDSGEAVESLNLITRRTCFQDSTALTVDPFLQNLPVYTGTSPTYTAISASNLTITDFVRAAFAYERGGMIVELRPSTTALAAIGQGPQEAYSPFTTEFETIPGNPRHYNYVSIDAMDTPTSRAYVPRYTPNSLFKCSQGGGQTIEFMREPGRNAGLVSLVSRASGGTAITTNFYGHATADDHQFCLFIGWPALVVPTSFA